MMKKIKNVRIAPRLVASFLIVAILAAAMGVVGISVLGSTNSQYSHMYDAYGKSQGTFGKMAISYWAIRLDIRNIIISNDQKQIQTLVDDIEAKKQDILQILASLQGDAKKLADQNKLQENMNAFFADLDQVTQLLSAGNKDEAMNHINTAGPTLTVNAQKSVQDTLDLATATGDTESAALDKTTKTFTLVLLGLSVLAFALALALGLFLSSTMNKPLNSLVNVAKKISSGDTSVNIDIESNDEIGILAKTFREMVRSWRDLIADVNKLLQAAESGDLSVRADAAAHQGEFSKIIGGFNNTLDVIVKPVQEVTAVLRKTAGNDLTKQVEGEYQGDLKLMADAMNDTVVRLIAIQSLFINMAKGDLSQLDEYKMVGKRSENDALVPSAIHMMESLTELTNEAKSLSGEAAKGNLDVRGDTAKFEGVYRDVIGGINSLIDAMVAPVNDAVEQMNHMADNDFTGGMSAEYSGEFARLATAFNTVVETMNQMLGNIGVAADQVASGTQQVSSGAQALSQGATEQASSIEELTGSLSEIAGQTKQNAVNANQASELANAAREEAADGNARMDDLQRAMKEINEASANISKIIKVIDDIAFQTNLLALNAAVEAARAGQHGKGFAVVAEEVRNLAQRSASAAKETTAMIEESIRRVKDGTKIADETAQSLSRIVSGVDKATELVGGIAKASNDQATAVAQVNSGIEQVSQVVQTNSATAEQSAAASEELSSQAVLLKEMVGKFSLRDNAGFTSKPVAKRAVSALTDGKPMQAKPIISLNQREFGKY